VAEDRARAQVSELFDGGGEVRVVRLGGARAAAAGERGEERAAERGVRGEGDDPPAVLIVRAERPQRRRAGVAQVLVEQAGGVVVADESPEPAVVSRRTEVLSGDARGLR